MVRSKGLKILILLLAYCFCALPPSEAADMDFDGIEDSIDNCLLFPNNDQIDIDLDGYGNKCDADYDQSGAATIADFLIFQVCFGKSVPPSGTAPSGDPFCAESDMDSSGGIVIGDFLFFQAEFGTSPGPSGLSCKHTLPYSPPNNPDPPCAAPSGDHDGDTFHDIIDNCPQWSNGNQVEGDGDGIGQACDACPIISNLADEIVPSLGAGGILPGDFCPLRIAAIPVGSTIQVVCDTPANSSPTFEILGPLINDELDLGNSVPGNFTGTLEVTPSGLIQIYWDDGICQFEITYQLDPITYTDNTGSTYDTVLDPG